ncbi:MAG: adenosylcobinamide-GDP ribazoletransferase [Moorellales bacterium]
MAGGVRSVWRGLRTAFAFLTRLPVGGGEWSEADYRASLLWFPLVGALIGLAQASVGWVTLPLLGLPVAAAVVVAAGVLLSGSLHLDGLMDTADGLACGKPPPEALAVMRDSNVGAYGVAAAVLALLLQFACAQALLRLDYAPLAGAYATVCALSRAVLVVAIARYPYARPQGLGRVFQGAGGREAAGALWVAVAIAGALASWPGLVLLGLAVGLALLYCWRLERVFGGLTGDMYGALAELETTVLLLAAVAWWA